MATFELIPFNWYTKAYLPFDRAETLNSLDTPVAIGFICCSSRTHSVPFQKVQASKSSNKADFTLATTRFFALPFTPYTYTYPSGCGAPDALVFTNIPAPKDAFSLDESFIKKGISICRLF